MQRIINFGLPIALLAMWCLGQVAQGLECYSCGSMSDGTQVMALSNVVACQFFESDIREEPERFVANCGDDKCCFALREHLGVTFWGHKASAEVFVQGCCNDLANMELHHSSLPPETLRNKAEVMTPTLYNGSIQSRALFCTSDRCNSRHVPWDRPTRFRMGKLLLEPRREVVRRRTKIRQRVMLQASEKEDGRQPDLKRVSEMSGGERRQGSMAEEDLNVIDLLDVEERPRSIGIGRRIRIGEKKDSNSTLNSSHRPRISVARSFFRSPVCECNCNCPTCHAPSTSSALKLCFSPIWRSSIQFSVYLAVMKFVVIGVNLV